MAGIVLADVGEQGTADFNVNTTSGTCVLSLTGKAIPKVASRCDISFISIIL